MAAIAAAATPLIIAVVKILKQSGVMDESVNIEKIEEDLKEGDLENSSDIPPSEFDTIDPGIEMPWYQHTGVKVAGAVGGGLLLIGLGYAAFGRKRKQLPAPAPPKQELSGPKKTGNKSSKKQPGSKTEEDGIREIILT